MILALNSKKNSEVKVMNTDATSTESGETILARNVWKSLRVWPVVVLVAVMLLAKNITRIVDDGPSFLWMIAGLGPALLSMLIVLWWVTFSRARWFERVIGLFGILVSLVITAFTVDPSLHGPAFIAFTIPVGIVLFALALIVMRNVLSVRRTWVALGCALLGFLISTMLRTDGMWGNFAVELDWRWNKTAEQKLVEQKSASEKAPVSIDAAEVAASLAKAEWPNFRGPNYNSTQPGVTIDKDWAANPPREVWRIAVGPAWSSMLIAGDLLFTQEQRGDNEAVVCYRATDGQELWTSEIASRFFEPLGGLGPRATPTLADDSLYTLGAEGWLQCIDATSGESKWKVDLRSVAKREPPMWGFSASPYVSESSVIVYAGGEEKGIVAFDRNDGTEQWSAPCGKDSYASVQTMRFDGVDYLAILSDEGLHLYDPQNGNVRLNYEWKHQGYRSLQPQLLDGNKVLIPTGMGTGTRLVEVAETDEQLRATELWTTRRLKSDFNDCVLHQGFAYGFDDGIFACIDLKTGEKAWKGGRYGKGQVFLLPDSDALIVQSETGEIVLLEASPENGPKELGKITSMVSKSWNHPVVVGKRLYARTANEMGCWELK